MAKRHEKNAEGGKENDLSTREEKHVATSGQGRGLQQQAGAADFVPSKGTGTATSGTAERQARIAGGQMGMGGSQLGPTEGATDGQRAKKARDDE